MACFIFPFFLFGLKKSVFYLTYLAKSCEELLRQHAKLQPFRLKDAKVIGRVIRNAQGSCRIQGVIIKLLTLNGVHGLSGS